MCTLYKTIIAAYSSKLFTIAIDFHYLVCRKFFFLTFFLSNECTKNKTKLFRILPSIAITFFDLITTFFTFIKQSDACYPFLYSCIWYYMKKKKHTHIFYASLFYGFHFALTCIKYFKLVLFYILKLFSLAYRLVETLFRGKVNLHITHLFSREKKEKWRIYFHFLMSKSYTFFFFCRCCCVVVFVLNRFPILNFIAFGFVINSKHPFSKFHYLISFKACTKEKKELWKSTFKTPGPLVCVLTTRESG